MHAVTKITVTLGRRELTSENLRSLPLRGTLRIEVNGKVVEQAVQCDLPQFDKQLNCVLSLMNADA